MEACWCVQQQIWQCFVGEMGRFAIQSRVYYFSIKVLYWAMNFFFSWDVILNNYLLYQIWFLSIERKILPRNGFEDPPSVHWGILCTRSFDFCFSPHLCLNQFSFRIFFLSTTLYCILICTVLVFYFCCRAMPIVISGISFPCYQFRSTSMFEFLSVSTRRWPSYSELCSKFAVCLFSVSCWLLKSLQKLVADPQVQWRTPPSSFPMCINAPAVIRSIYSPLEGRSPR